MIAGTKEVEEFAGHHVPPPPQGLGAADVAAFSDPQMSQKIDLTSWEDPGEALEWIREQGVVLQSARGPIPNLAEWIAGEPIRGSWWGHPAGHKIFRAIGSVRASGDVVATRLVNGKVTLVHRRVWPALLRVADRFPSWRLASIDEEHTETGAHRRVETQFPDWVPAEVFALAEALADEQALGQLPSCLH